MPWGDGTGPWWGGGNWRCWRRSFGSTFGPGRGRGFGRGFGKYWKFGSQVPAKDEKQMLEEEVEILEEDLKTIKERLTEIKGQE